MQEEYFYLGILTKSFGYKGELFLYLDTDEPEKYSRLDALFIQNGAGEKIPYFIEKFHYRGNNLAVVKFKEIDGDGAKELIKSEIYLPISLLPPLTGNRFYYHEVIGFKVIDKNRGEVGTITDFIEFSKQPIMQIDCAGVEILVPAIDQFFEKVDRELRTIFIVAPDGLLDVYLEK